MATTDKASTTAAVRRFPNWTFDGACPSMEWTAPSTTQLSIDRSDLQDADLVVVGVVVNPKTGGAGGSNKNVPSLQARSISSSSSSTTRLTGFAATMDQGLHGALSELLAEDESQTALASAGGLSTILRVVEPTKRYVLLSLGGTDNTDNNVSYSIS